MFVNWVIPKKKYYCHFCMTMVPLQYAGIHNYFIFLLTRYAYR